MAADVTLRRALPATMLRTIHETYNPYIFRRRRALPAVFQVLIDLHYCLRFCIILRMNSLVFFHGGSFSGVHRICFYIFIKGIYA